MRFSSLFALSLFLLATLVSCNGDSTGKPSSDSPPTTSLDAALLGSWLALEEMDGRNTKSEFNYRFEGTGVWSGFVNRSTWNGQDWSLSSQKPAFVNPNQSFHTRDGFLFMKAFPLDSLPDFSFEYIYWYRIKTPDEIEWADARIYQGTGDRLIGQWTSEYWSAGRGGPPEKQIETLEFTTDGTFRKVGEDTLITRFRDHGAFFELYEVLEQTTPDTVKNIRYYRILDGTLYSWNDNLKYLTRQGKQPRFGVVRPPDNPDARAGMKVIPSMGRTVIIGYDGGETNEKPAHEVTFAYSFSMDSTEATKGEFYSVLGYRPWIKWSSDFGSGKGDEFSASELNWYDAVLYCNQRSKNLGLDTVYAYDSLCWGCGSNQSLRFTYQGADLGKNGFRLPTNSEWEFAARGGTQTVYFWGSTVDYSYADGWSELKHPVTTKRPNAFGLYGMAGGQPEWMHDCLRAYTVTPRDGSAPSDCREGEVLRGGTNWSEAHFRASYRAYQSPDYSQGGVRCVLPE